MDVPRDSSDEGRRTKDDVCPVDPECEPAISNCTIAGNQGGGITADWSTTKVMNSIIWGNWPAQIARHYGTGKGNLVTFILRSSGLRSRHYGGEGTTENGRPS